VEPSSPRTLLDLLRCTSKLIDHYESTCRPTPALPHMKHFLQRTIEELEAATKAETHRGPQVVPYSSVRGMTRQR
jgi:hypothetical protein